MEPIPTSAQTTPTATPTPSLIDYEEEDSISKQFLSSPNRKIFFPPQPPKPEYLIKFPTNPAPNVQRPATSSRDRTPHHMLTLSQAHKNTPPVLPEQPHLQLDIKTTEDEPSFFGNSPTRDLAMHRTISSPVVKSSDPFGTRHLDPNQHKLKHANVAKNLADSVENVRRVDERYSHCAKYELNRS